MKPGTGERRIVVAWCLAIVLAGGAAGCACHGDQDPVRDGAFSPGEPVRVDPVTFVLVYHTDFERILAKHQDDCAGALTSLLRFVAERREEFLAHMHDKPAGWRPAAAGDQVELFMEFADRCPEEVARLNQSLHGITP